MTPVTDIVDLGQLGLKPGGAIRFDARVPVGDFVFSEEHYKLAEDPVPAKVEITRTTSGNVIRVQLQTTLNGPCMRCHADYSFPVEVDHSEVHEPHLDEDLRSEYVSGLELNLAALIRDAVGLSLPTSISSPADENGVCTECPDAAARIARLQDSDPEAEESAPDPRWAKLRELEL